MNILDIIKTLPLPLKLEARNLASKSLVEQGFEEVGSSDINNELKNIFFDAKNRNDIVTTIIDSVAV